MNATSAVGTDRVAISPGFVRMMTAFATHDPPSEAFECLDDLAGFQERDRSDLDLDSDIEVTHLDR